MLELNKIHNMDCMDGLKLLKNESIDLIVTDPPYRVTSRGNVGNSGGMLRKKIYREGRVFQYNDIETSIYMPELYRVLKNGSHFYIMTNHVNLHKTLTILQNVGFHFIKSLIWDKGNKIMGTAYMIQFEYILFCRKGIFKKINHCGTANILSIQNKKTKDNNGENIHDTEKPVQLMEILIDNSTQKNDIVLDPFMGVGSTALACKNLSRNFIGFEINKGYCDIAESRIMEYNKNIKDKEQQILLEI